MNLRTALLLLTLTVGVLVGVQQPADAAPDVRPDTPVRLADVGVDEYAGSARVGDLLVFTGVVGGDYEPWVTDGTPAGTHRLLNIAPGPDSSGPHYFASYRGRVYFAAYTREQGEELWVTDGTAAGTRLVKDIWPGSGRSDLRYLTVAGGLLYFRAQTPANGLELWVSDGTAAGTRLHTDVRPGPLNSNPHNLVALGARVLFSAFVSETVTKPYVTTPVPGVIDRLDSGPMDVNFPTTEFSLLGDRVLLAAEELWESRGSAGDARILKEIDPGAANGAPEDLTHVGERVVFSADTSTEGREPWVSDGTPDGTVLLRDIQPGAADGDPAGFVATPAGVFFEARDSDVDRLWLTRGTPESTRQVALPPGVTEIEHIIGSAAGQVTVLAHTADSMVVVTTDGTASGTRVLPELGPGPDGEAYGIGTLGGTQLVATLPDKGPQGLYAWTAAGSSSRAKPRPSYAAAVARSKQIRVPVRVRTSTGQRLTGGLVTLTKKGRVVGRARLVDGVARVRIRVRLRPGHRHHLRAAWTGTIDASASVSPRFTVRVRPRR